MMTNMRAVFMVVLGGLVASAPLRAEVPAPAVRPVKVVVVTMYEIGEDTGDTAGELQRWVERGSFDERVSFPLGHRDGYWREAHWVVAGIAGADPQDCSLGSAAWARWVVDGDLAYEIDGREIPADWPYGFIALGAHEPNTLEDGWTVETIAFELNPALVDWAYSLTKDMVLPDDPALRAFRAQFAGELPNAARPPFVLIGDSLGASTYWHGALLNGWANDWMKLHTGGAANFVMSNMEDNGTLTALHRLGQAGLADPQRVLVLRTASNFSMPPPGKDAGWSTTAEYPANGEPAKESAYLVANRVVEALVAGAGP